MEPNIAREDFLGIIDEISSAESVQELIASCEKYADYRCGIYHHIPAIGAYNYNALNRFWSIGLSEDVTQYLERKSDAPDSAMKYIFSKARPYWMSDLLEAEELSSEKDQYRINLSLKYVGDGLLLPLFGPFNKRGYIFASFNKSREFYDPIFTWQVLGILQAVHIRYCMILEGLRTSVKLTGRESEVLELITFGKTNPEIGIILGITSNTVSGHVKRIFLKLGVTDRVTAALRAQSFNL